MEILQLFGEKKVKDACPGELKTSDAISRNRKEQTECLEKEMMSSVCGKQGCYRMFGRYPRAGQWPTSLEHSDTVGWVEFSF